MKIQEKMSCMEWKGEQAAVTGTGKAKETQSTSQVDFGTQMMVACPKEQIEKVEHLAAWEGSPLDGPPPFGFQSLLGLFSVMAVLSNLCPQFLWDVKFVLLKS